MHTSYLVITIVVVNASTGIATIFPSFNIKDILYKAFCDWTRWSGDITIFTSSKSEDALDSLNSVNVDNDKKATPCHHYAEGKPLNTRPRRWQQLLQRSTAVLQV